MDNKSVASGFTSSALTKFDYLVTDYGFYVAATDATIVRFVSTGVFVKVYNWQVSSELGVDVGLLTDGSAYGIEYDLGELVHLRGPWEYNHYRGWSGSIDLAIDHGLSYLADELRRCGAEALRGDLGVFDQLAAQRERNVEAFGRYMNAMQSRSGAEEAWSRRDYAGVVRFYDNMQQDLSPAERKKLEYSRKKWMSAKQR